MNDMTFGFGNRGKIGISKADRNCFKKHFFLHEEFMNFLADCIGTQHNCGGVGRKWCYRIEAADGFNISGFNDGCRIFSAGHILKNHPCFPAFS
jgi:hypothetical protein